MFHIYEGGKYYGGEKTGLQTNERGEANMSLNSPRLYWCDFYYLGLSLNLHTGVHSWPFCLFIHSKIESDDKRFSKRSQFCFISCVYFHRRDDKRLTKKEKPPHNITVVKGPVHMVASRAFVEFIFNDQKAKDFLEWVHGTQVPDETYFPTLQNNPHLGTPGAFGGNIIRTASRPRAALYVR